MERVSARLFFKTLWKGLCQAIGWFFGLFGYNRDGKFAKCVWGLFATSAAVITGIVAISLLYLAGMEIYNKYCARYQDCDDKYCYESEFISRYIYFHDHQNRNGYVYNILTGEKTLRHVTWIAKPLGNDSLVCFSNGKKRGYLNMFTGKVVIEPEYDRAWVFSDGLACVEDGGFLKFIDGTGKTVIDKKMAYIPGMEGYVFHGGYCVVDSDDGERCGLMDKTGKIVLPLEYSRIKPTSDLEHWVLRKGNEMAVLDKDLKPVIPFTECAIYVGDGTIDMTMPDHTIRKYDMEGNLINDFYVSCVRTLEYEKEEILYRKTKTYEDTDEESTGDIIEPYHPLATARLRAYGAGDSHEGLMTADGHVVTKPLYEDITAIGYDLYLCTYTNCDKVLVNGKGEIVK